MPPRVTRYTIPNHQHINLRFAMVSDLHDQDGAEVLRLLEREAPELILIPGDLLERTIPPEGFSRIFEDDWKQYHTKWTLLAERVAAHLALLFKAVFHVHGTDAHFGLEFLREATKIAPTCYSIGNHERYMTEEDLQAVERSGAAMLDNADTAFFTRDGEMVRIGGLSTCADERWLAEFDALDGYKLLLCHHPEYFIPKIQRTGIDLTVSGHAHGGQLRILGQGLYAPGQGFFPKLTRGLYFGGRLLVGTGLHYSGGLPRWGNPTEVVIVELGVRN